MTVSTSTRVPCGCRLGCFRGRICLVSDALRCCGMPDGEYEIGGQRAYLKDCVARLEDGTIAGSATNLFGCMQKAVAFGIPPEDAVRAATFNPACALGMEDRLGVIAQGREADFVICDKDFQLLAVYIGGERVPTGR